MTRVYFPLDLSQVKTVPLAQRGHKVGVEQFAGRRLPRARFVDFLDGLPDIPIFGHSGPGRYAINYQQDFREPIQGISV